MGMSIKDSILSRIPETTVLMFAFLWVWYALELFVLQYFGLETSKWWFYARPEFSPGWVLAPISHSLENIQHILGNTILLLLVGSLLEREMSSREYVGILLGITFLSTLIPIALNILLSNENWFTVGASGGVVGLLGMYLLLQFDSDFDTIAGRSEVASERPYKGAFLITLFAVIIPFAGGNLVSHWSGLVFGTLFARIRL